MKSRVEMVTLFLNMAIPSFSEFSAYLSNHRDLIFNLHGYSIQFELSVISLSAFEPDSIIVSATEPEVCVA